jgi:hypothetical protein
MRRKAAPILVIIVLLLFCGPFLASPQPPSQAPAPPAKPKMSNGEMMNEMLKSKPLLPQSTDGGLWRIDHSFTSSIMLKNVVTISPIVVTPILYMADGTEYGLPAVNLDPAGVAVLNINSALQNAPSNILPHLSTYGSVGIRFKWLWAGAVTAAVRSGDDVRSLVYVTRPHADTMKVNDPAAIQSAQTLEGMWWQQEPGVSGFMTLTNTSQNAITANLQVFNSAGTNAVTADQSVALAPHNTTMVDLTALWGQLPSVIPQGGVRVSYTGVRDAVVVEAGLEDGVKGYSHTLKMRPVQGANASAATAAQGSTPTAAPPQTVNLDSTGIMVGTQDSNMQFPEGTKFSPYLVFRNMTDASLPVQLTVNYSTGGTPANISVGNLTLPAQGIQQVNLTAMLAGVGLASYNGYLNLRTSFVGNPTDILEESGSLDQTNSYVFEAPPTMEGAGRGEISPFWNASGDTDTMYNFWNYSAKDEDLILTLYYQAGQYKLPIHLAANASLTISIASLIKSGQPDAAGNTIPITTVQGSSKLTGPSGTDMDLIHVSMHSAIFNVRTGTCFCECNFCNYVCLACTQPSPTVLGIGDVVLLCPFVVLYDACCCNLLGQMDWDTSSGYSSVATIDGGGNVTGVGAGETFFTGTSTQTFPRNAGEMCGTEWSLCLPLVAAAIDADVGVTATPTNFHQTNVADEGNGDLRFAYAWDSTSGSLADLSSCTIFETVTYPGAPGSFTMAVPFPNITNPNPTVTNQPAVPGSFEDDNALASNGTQNTNFRTPFSGSSFTATQVFRYSCLILGSNFSNQLYPTTLGESLPIVRTVTSNGDGTFKFTVTKPTGGTATINPISQ